jgi:TatD DNase family protein
VVDTHCHLDSCKPPDDELVARAREAGLKRLATVGMNEASIERAVAAANTYDDVYAIVGRHPHETTGFDPDADMAAIERAAADPRVRAIGETGLDYFRDYAPRDDQRRAFEAHIDLAARTGLSLVIHTRAAEDDTLAVLRERAGELTVVMHCFSMPGHATELQEAARQVPEELLLVETDSPYLSPQPVRGKPNEPANVTRTAEHVAQLRGVTYDELEATVEANAARVFGW